MRLLSDGVRMRLKTKLVVAATGLTFAIVVVLSSLFVERVAAAEDRADGGSERRAGSSGLVDDAAGGGERAACESSGGHEATRRSTRQWRMRCETTAALTDVMNAIVRYSLTVQDVSVTDAQGMILVSTDPGRSGTEAGSRFSLANLQSGSIARQMREVFGAPKVLDMSQALDRNGKPFLVVHVGVRSTFLKNSYEPWLRAALWFALAAALASMIAAGLLANVALRPLEAISSTAGS